MNAMDLADRLYSAARRNGWRALRALPADHVLMLLEFADPELYVAFRDADPMVRQDALFMVTEAEVASYCMRSWFNGVDPRVPWPSRRLEAES